MAKFGVATVPFDKGGSSIELCRGSGKHGLNDEFAAVADEFIESALESKGYSIIMGDYGFISKSQAERLAGKTFGRPGYLKAIDRFGWGLAWEVSAVYEGAENGKYVQGKTKSVDIDSVFASSDVSRELSSRGLEYRYETRDGKEDSITLRYITAAKVVGSSDVDKIEVSGSSLPDGNSSVTSSTSSSSSRTASVASTSYFFANQFDSVTDYAMANMLTGERALANDEALWNYVKKAVNASLRSCSSDPDGNFIAWYPDYFGKYGKTPKVVIQDVELVDLSISQSDKEFYSHVFCPGFNMNGDKFDIVRSTGVVSIESNDAAELSQAALGMGDQVVSDAVSPLLDALIYIPEGEEWRYTPAELYRRYGARPAKTPSLPNFGEAKLIEDQINSEEASDSSVEPYHILPFLYALYEFMNHWAKQYSAKIEVTFMPEVFPGMRIKVASFDISFYVDSVTHNMSYTGGFTTTLKCSCPVGSLVSGMVNPD